MVSSQQACSWGVRSVRFCFLRFIYFYFVHVSVGLHVCMCTMRVPDVWRDQKRISDPLGRGLQTVVSHMWVLGTELRPPVRAASAPSAELGEIVLFWVHLVDFLRSQAGYSWGFLPPLLPWSLQASGCLLLFCPRALRIQELERFLRLRSKIWTNSRGSLSWEL